MNGVSEAPRPSEAAAFFRAVSNAFSLASSSGLQMGIPSNELASAGETLLGFEFDIALVMGCALLSFFELPDNERDLFT